ncbi:hypothetical protein [Devosia ginsengisoli]|uniref:DUF992 domain-containing protein n=1 Tax=Devosia ginsengisoli TaxID=400770 RepID=A0A5B8LXV7_9HYPH|nr:hypothetical protein [Devosia ginsengisoli]QDZ12524.1 hypothetical protein FPZ08_18265 [Devosia ginsengisoli]
MGSHPAQILIPALLLLVLPATAQETGWHYSPLPGEGDRAALGCALNSTPQAYACIAVRCEDDFTTGVHIHTSRQQSDAGDWAITVDKETRSFTAESAEPYGARLVGDFSWVLHNLSHGAVAYLAPEDGSAMPANHIPLDGSLYAINAALAFCAPRVSVEPIPDEGV